MEDREPREPLAKPDALLALHDVTAELFLTLRRWFGVPVAVSLDLAEIDSAVEEIGDPVMIAAMAMRKLQALHLLSTPGVLTTTDVVITIVQDLDRALVQAPTMRLKVQAASTDWDAAFVELGRHASATPPEGSSNHPSRVDDPDGVPLDPSQADPAAERFRELHGCLHEAVYAVLEISAGEIRQLL